MKNVQRVKLYWILTQNQIFKNYLMKHYVIWYEKQKLFILIFIRVEIFIFKIVTISIYIRIYPQRRFREYFRRCATRKIDPL